MCRSSKCGLAQRSGRSEMGGKSRVTSGLLLDANVIIDFQMAGSLDLFTEIGRCSGPLWVVDRTLDEVNGFNRQDCRRLKIGVHRATVVELEQALPSRGVSLSEADALNFIVAKNYQMTLVTNENVLRTRCGNESIPTLRSLALLTALVSAGRLTRTRAWSIGREIRRVNPHQLPEVVLVEFANHIGVTLE